jgi:hypothetical protein
VWELGPFSGVVVRGDGTVRLALDPHALVPRARALARVPETRGDAAPSRPSRPAPLARPTRPER